VVSVGSPSWDQAGIQSVSSWDSDRIQLTTEIPARVAGYPTDSQSGPSRVPPQSWLRPKIPGWYQLSTSWRPGGSQQEKGGRVMCSMVQDLPFPLALLPPTIWHIMIVLFGIALQLTMCCVSIAAWAMCYFSLADSAKASSPVLTAFAVLAIW
jgi:hypothetical protein